MPKMKAISLDLRKELLMLTEEEMDVQSYHSISECQELEREVSIQYSYDWRKNGEACNPKIIIISTVKHVGGNIMLADASVCLKLGISSRWMKS